MIQSLRSPEQLRDLAARGVAATLHPASGPMPTVASAAAALGIPVAAMTKNIVCLAGGAPVLVIAAGLARIDDRALARHLGAVLMLLPLLLLLPGSGGPRAAGSDRPAGRAAPAAGTTFVLYDGARGSTPDAQGMALNPPSLATRQSYADGVTTLATQRSDYVGYFADAAGIWGNTVHVPALDRTAGYTVTVTVKVVQEDHSNSDRNGDGVSDRAGFSLIALSRDTRGVELGFWQSEIWAQDGRTPVLLGGTLFTHAEGAAFDTQAGLITYTLAVRGDRYALSGDGVPILSGRLRDYSAFKDPLVGPNPYKVPSFIFVGDNTSIAGATVELAYLAVAPANSQAFFPDRYFLPLVARQ